MTKDNYEILQATAEDKIELTRLRIAYLCDDFGELSDEEKTHLNQVLPDYFEQHTGIDCFPFVAQTDERLVAIAVLVVVAKPASKNFPNGRTGEVLSVYTEPAYRKKGICTALINSLIAKAQELKLDIIDLSASQDGYPVYEKTGFVRKTSKYVELRYSLNDR